MQANDGLENEAALLCEGVTIRVYCVQTHLTKRLIILATTPRRIAWSDRPWIQQDSGFSTNRRARRSAIRLKAQVRRPSGQP